MKKYLLYSLSLLFICYLFFCNLLVAKAQNSDTITTNNTKITKKGLKKSLWLGTNLTMPLFALAFGGYGFELNGLYFLSNNFGLSLGTGLADYKNMGLNGSRNYSSFGQHIRAGIVIGSATDFVLYHSGISNETVKLGFLFGLNYVWANVHETGYWNAPSTSYWGGGYNFDVWRQADGLEFSTTFFLTTLNQRHSFNFKPYISIFAIENSSYFPMSAASGFGYLPFSSKDSGGTFTVGMQIWYYFRLVN